MVGGVGLVGGVELVESVGFVGVAVVVAVEVALVGSLTGGPPLPVGYELPESAVLGFLVGSAKEGYSDELAE